MEAQLLEYRKKKAKEQKSGNSFVRNLFSQTSKEAKTDFTTVTKREFSTEKNKEHLEDAVNTDTDRKSSDTDLNTLRNSPDPSWKPRLLLCLYIVLWLVLWKFFIEIQFGAVYFILSLSYIGYKNTRTGPRDHTKLSAYSVFNANQERLDGTFTTEQFEKEIRFGAASVK